MSNIMKTIEQLADEYVGHQYELGEDLHCSFERQAFIDGAKAQRKIDEESYEGKALLHAVNKTAYRTKKELIDKACDWLFLNIGHYIDALGYADTHELEVDFREAMEEEI